MDATWMASLGATFGKLAVTSYTALAMESLTVALSTSTLTTLSLRALSMLSRLNPV